MAAMTPFLHQKVKSRLFSLSPHHHHTPARCPLPSGDSEAKGSQAPFGSASGLLIAIPAMAQLSALRVADEAHV